MQCASAKRAHDLERIAQKVRFTRHPRDLGSLRVRWRRSARCGSGAAGTNPLLQTPATSSRCSTIGETLVGDPRTAGDGVRYAPSDELAECTTLRTDARSKLAELEAR